MFILKFQAKTPTDLIVEAEKAQRYSNYGVYGRHEREIAIKILKVYHVFLLLFQQNFTIKDFSIC